jgi:hypothetical protein
MYIKFYPTGLNQRFFDFFRLPLGREARYSGNMLTRELRNENVIFQNLTLIFETVSHSKDHTISNKSIVAVSYQKR